MSEIAALESFGDFHSAFYFRDLYLRDDTMYTEFYCPFCGVPLITVLVYAPAEQELGTSPHFRTQPRGAKHFPGCDGNPSKYKHAHDKKPIQAHIEKCSFTLPTEFSNYVERPPHPSLRGPDPVPTRDAILRRRNTAGETYGTARFSVSLVQSLSEAHLAVLSEAYDRQRKEGWTKEELKAWLNGVLQAPINLRGYKTTYRNAFHDLWFAVPRSPRVFHGKYAQVIATNDGYEIVSVRSGKIDEPKSEKPFVILVSLEEMDVELLRGARRVLITQLQRAVTEDTPVRWYAYGYAQLTEVRFELRIDKHAIGDLFVTLQKRT